VRDRLWIPVAALLMSVPSALLAQKAVTKAGDPLKTTATIQELDTTSRMVTLRGADGDELTVVAGPEVKRFNELKVGDKVNFTYYESTVYQVRKPGMAAPAVAGGASLTAAKGTLPGGTAAVQAVQTVTVKSLDPSVPSITVTTADGRTITRKVDKKEHLDGVKAGDKIDITYTEALMASVEPAR
jgi:Cu/Ag efflux protein CusF